MRRSFRVVVIAAFVAAFFFLIIKAPLNEGTIKLLLALINALTGLSSGPD